MLLADPAVVVADGAFDGHTMAPDGACFISSRNIPSGGRLACDHDPMEKPSSRRPASAAALGEPDGAKAEMLYKLADEAERNVLCTPDWMRERLRGPSFINRAGDS
jgi:hypothetical protein